MTTKQMKQEQILSELPEEHRAKIRKFESKHKDFLSIAEASDFINQESGAYFSQFCKYFFGC